MRGLSILSLVAVIFLQTTEATMSAEPSRRLISLDGIWQIAEGKMEQVPVGYERTAPVPGLVSLATPAFADPPGPKVADRQSLSQKDPRRDAFWYRRTFTMDGPIPAVATLKIAKAMFGTRVYLNGKLLGDHAPCFTPGYFNTKPSLKTGENEIAIRVGADRDAVGRAHPDGFDFEKDRYIPGIFDSVGLILSGTPHFESVQIAPDIATGVARIQAKLRNAGEPVKATCTFVVREAKSGKLVGKLAADPVKMAKDSETTVDVRVPISGCRLWSPEDPFLYTLEADSGMDCYQTRFGMREFKFDFSTRHAMLNGRPYFMRGSNITLYRFFEDSECKDLPWHQDWVRLLHQRVKEMHWNCLRYCIGFPPEAWYDAADETGILIDDEFPIWFGGDVPKEMSSDELAREYAEWLRERWNHPCVAIWDADNETLSTKTGTAINRVRALDLSNRPWDDGYSPPQEPGDMLESHPYHFNGNFRLHNLATANQEAGDGKHAVVINEYGWHWINRDGTPTTLTQELYWNVLGESATPEQRFHMQATWLAADTEFWRSHRKAAAVMHFTTLGYSRPDGQTSDHWKPGGVEKLEWEPEFYKYVRDSFAPVGMCVNYWKDRLIEQTSARIPVILTNDLDQSWSGPVILRLRKSGNPAAIFEVKQDARLEPFGQMTLNYDLSWPETTGSYLLEAELLGTDQQPIHSVREVEIVDAHSLGLAYGKPTTASSVQGAEYESVNAVDGDLSTYWSSTFADPAWLSVDLGVVRKIGRVQIVWEIAYSKVFSVQVSSDGQNWTDVFEEKAGKGGVSEIKFAPVEARYVRLSCTQRGTQWGHAVRELLVFE